MRRGRNNTVCFAGNDGNTHVNVLNPEFDEKVLVDFDRFINEASTHCTDDSADDGYQCGEIDYLLYNDDENNDENDSKSQAKKHHRGTSLSCKFHNLSVNYPLFDETIKNNKANNKQLLVHQADKTNENINGKDERDEIIIQMNTSNCNNCSGNDDSEIEQETPRMEMVPSISAGSRSTSQHAQSEYHGFQLSRGPKSLPIISKFIPQIKSNTSNNSNDEFVNTVSVTPMSPSSEIQIAPETAPEATTHDDPDTPSIESCAYSQSDDIRNHRYKRSSSKNNNNHKGKDKEKDKEKEKEKMFKKIPGHKIHASLDATQAVLRRQFTSHRGETTKRLETFFHPNHHRNSYTGSTNGTNGIDINPDHDVYVYNTGDNDDIDNNISYDSSSPNDKNGASMNIVISNEALKIENNNSHGKCRQVQSNSNSQLANDIKKQKNKSANEANGDNKKKGTCLPMPVVATPGQVVNTVNNRQRMLTARRQKKKLVRFSNGYGQHELYHDQVENIVSKYDVFDLTKGLKEKGSRTYKKNFRPLLYVIFGVLSLFPSMFMNEIRLSRLFVLIHGGIALIGTFIDLFIKFRFEVQVSSKLFQEDKKMRMRQQMPHAQQICSKAASIEFEHPRQTEKQSQQQQSKNTATNRGVTNNGKTTPSTGTNTPTLTTITANQDVNDDNNNNNNKCTAGGDFTPVLDDCQVKSKDFIAAQIMQTKSEMELYIIHSNIFDYILNVDNVAVLVPSPFGYTLVYGFFITSLILTLSNQLIESCFEDDETQFQLQETLQQLQGDSYRVPDWYTWTTVCHEEMYSNEIHIEHGGCLLRHACFSVFVSFFAYISFTSFVLLSTLRNKSKTRVWISSKFLKERFQGAGIKTERLTKSVQKNVKYIMDYKKVIPKLGIKIPYVAIFLILVCACVSSGMLFVQKEFLTKNKVYKAQIIYFVSIPCTSLFLFGSVSCLWRIYNLYKTSYVIMRELGRRLKVSSKTDIIEWVEIRKHYVLYRLPMRYYYGSFGITYIFFGTFISVAFTVFYVVMENEGLNYFYRQGLGFISTISTIVLTYSMLKTIKLAVKVSIIQKNHRVMLYAEKVRLDYFASKLNDSLNANNRNQSRRMMYNYNMFRDCSNLIETVIKWLEFSDKPPKIAGISMTSQVLVGFITYVVAASLSIMIKTSWDYNYNYS